MSLPNNTPTSSRHRSPRISAAATNKSAASSSTSAPSVTRTLNYEDVEDAEDDEEVAAAVRGVESAQETQQSVMTQPVAGGKNFCDVDNCPGFNFLPGVACSICKADLHMECFLGTVRKLNEYTQGCHNEIFCSDVCCQWHGNDKVDVALVRKERRDLQNLLKKQHLCFGVRVLSPGHVYCTTCMARTAHRINLQNVRLRQRRQKRQTSRCHREKKSQLFKY